MEKPIERPTMYQACLLHSRADRVLRTLVGELLEKFQVTMMEWLLLGVVSEGPKEGLTLSKIAQVLDVSQPQVTALMDRVTAQNLVKQKTLKHDRRSRSVILSVRGRRLVDKIESAVGDYIREWLQEIPADQLQAYLATIHYISEYRPAEH